MNRAYKLVWSRISNSWVVASELAKSGKKSSGKALKLALLMAAGFSAAAVSAAPAANTLPTGGALAGNGVYSIDSSVPNQLTINQSDAAMLASWDTFSIGSNAKVIFNQPSTSSFAFNRVNGASPSEIFGQVQANGHFVLVNPSGITFGAGSQVNAAAIVASTNPMAIVSLLSNVYAFSASASATAKVENYGTLTATAGGVTLLGSQVVNAGNIIATGGDVRLLNAGSTSFNNGVPTLINPSAMTGFIQNSGNISATQVIGVGGRILLTGDTSQTASQIQLAGTLDGTETQLNGRSILVNADVNLNGASNTLDFTATDGYSLNYGTAVNLNGISSGFSVNGTAYSVIRDVNQLQAMNSNLAGRYVLANNIDASDTLNWNAGAGFLPVGSQALAFNGALDGLGHSIDQLFINSSATYVGLIGNASGAGLQNIAVTNASITGSRSVGTLVGNYEVDGFAIHLRNLSSSGQVTSANQSADVGGLVGKIEAASGSILLEQSASSANVSANGVGSSVGGLLGSLAVYSFSGQPVTTATISKSYASGNVAGAGAFAAGGLVGEIFAGFGQADRAEVLNSYATGAVSSPQRAGGLVGAIRGNGNAQRIVSNSYASNTAISGPQAYGLVGAFDVGTGGAPIQLNNNYWNQESSGVSSAYNNSNPGFVAASNNVALNNSQLKQLGSFANWGSNIDAQGGSGSVWRIYEGQSAPLLRALLKPLTVSMDSITKTYDGTTYTPSYTLQGTADSSKILQSFAGVRNAGVYVLGSDSLYSTQDGYDLTVNAGSLTINKRQLTISATAASKEYDGRLTSADKPVVAGRVSGDSIAGLRQSYSDKNAGTGKTINVDAGFTIRDGNGGNNYDVLVLDNHNGVITPKALTISTVANSKAYDGGITSANKPLVTGLLLGDRITGLFQQYESKTVGENKQLLIRDGYLVQDGNGGNNYSVTEQTTNDGVIIAH